MLFAFNTRKRNKEKVPGRTQITRNLSKTSKILKQYTAHCTAERCSPFLTFQTFNSGWRCLKFFSADRPATRPKYNCLLTRKFETNVALVIKWTFFLRNWLENCECCVVVWTFVKIEKVLVELDCFLLIILYANC